MSNAIKIRGQKPQRARNKFLHEKRDRKRFEAQVRNDSYAALTPAQKLAKLDAGGFTAAKQRARLLAEAARPAAKIVAALDEAIKAEKPKFKKGAKAERQRRNDKKVKNG